MNTTKQPFDTIFKHSDFLVLYKPNELSFHDDGEQLGFFNLAKQQLNTEIWPVHRLDKVTSGLVIIAKSATSATEFGRLFENQLIDKTYLAISDKKPTKKQGKICGDMKKSRNGSWRLTKTNLSPAITRFHSSSFAPKKRLYFIKPKTGKTHQIRVALKSLGAPILGDKRYGGNAADRTYLHAYSLSFNWKGEYISIKTLPKEGLNFTLAETLSLIDSFE